MVNIFSSEANATLAGVTRTLEEYKETVNETYGEDITFNRPAYVR